MAKMIKNGQIGDIRFVNAEYAQDWGPQLAEADALEIVIAATEGLAAAHRHEVLHRDVKPHNVFLLRDRSTGDFQLGRSKLGDLGIARSAESTFTLTETDVAMGTLRASRHCSGAM